MAVVVWSPQGQQLASTGDDDLVQIWQIDPLQTKINYKAHKDNAQTLAWSPDGALLASTNRNSISIWNPVNGNTLTHFEGAYGTMLTLTWSPDSTQLAVGYDSSIIQTLTLHRQSAKLEPATLYMGHSRNEKINANTLWPIHKVIWSPKEKYIASASADKTIHVWDAATSKRHLTYRGHTETIYTFDWSPALLSSTAETPKTLRVGQRFLAGKRKLSHLISRFIRNQIKASNMNTYSVNSKESRICKCRQNDHARRSFCFKK